MPSPTPSRRQEELLQPEPLYRKLLGYISFCFTALAVLYFSFKIACTEFPQLCSKPFARTPSWVIALEPVARQFAPLVDFIAMGLKRGWKIAEPEIMQSWSEVAPTLNATTTAVDTALASFSPWQVAAGACAVTLIGLSLLRALGAWFTTVCEMGLVAYSLKVLKSFPGVRGMVDREIEKAYKEIWESVTKKGIPENDPPLVVLPPEGFPKDGLLRWLDVKAGQTCESTRPGKSKISGAVYFSGNDEHAAVLEAAYSAFSMSNPLHADVFPSTRRMEAEVVSICASLLGGGPHGLQTVCGLMTSGGTESILSAVKASRDFMKEYAGKTSPEMIIADSAHPAFVKAASYFGIKLVKLPVDKHYRLTASAVERAITRNTILVVASSPGYPHGVMDEVQKIAHVALKHRILCHVDGCLGAFVLPFARKLGYDVPAFDFSLVGVTSMSADTHKFGLSHKGTSVVLFRGPRLRHCLYTAFTEWSGGPYISPGFPGSRSGALIATAWASLAFMGRKGFMEVTERIMAVSKAFQAGLHKIEGLEVMGQPEMSVVAFRSHHKTINIYQLNDLLAEKGWHLCALHLPPALHMCFTAAHTMETVEELLADIEACRQQLLDKGSVAEGGSAKLYGMAASLPDRKLVGEILHAFQDVQLQIY